jgi:hypothetical protein
MLFDFVGCHDVDLYGIQFPSISSMGYSLLSQSHDPFHLQFVKDIKKHNQVKESKTFFHVKNYIFFMLFKLTLPHRHVAKIFYISFWVAKRKLLLLYLFIIFFYV